MMPNLQSKILSLYHISSTSDFNETKRAVIRELRRVASTSNRTPYNTYPINCVNERIRVGYKESINVEYSGPNKQMPDKFTDIQGNISGPEPYIYRFDDAELIGYHPVVKVNDSYFLARDVMNDTKWNSSISNIQAHVPLKYSILSSSNSKNAKKIESAYLLLSRRGTHYPNWITEILPKLIWYQQLCLELDHKPLLVTHSPLSEFQRESLKLMDININELLTHGQQVTGVKELYIPPHPIKTRSKNLYAIPSTLEKVRSKLISNVSNNNREVSDRIFVSRSDANTRRVVNQAQVMQCLEKYGFSSIEPGKYSFEEQVSIFSNANMIIGPTGAGLSNITFAGDGQVIELIPKGNYTKGTQWFVLANERGLKYDFVLSKPVNRNVNRPIQSDIHVDITSLEEKVSNLLSAY